MVDGVSLVMECVEEVVGALEDRGREEGEIREDERREEEGEGREIR